MKIVLLFVTMFVCMALSAQSQSDVQIMDGRKLFADTTKKASSNPSKPNAKTYKVEKGDSWNSIAAKFGVTYSQLRMANTESDELVSGKTINIPTDKIKVDDPYFDKKHIDSETDKSAEKYHVVQSGQTLYSISTKYNVSVENLKAWNKLSSNSISVGQKLIIGFGAKEKPAPVKTVQPTQEEVKVEPKKPVQKEVETKAPPLQDKPQTSVVVTPPSPGPITDDKIVFASTRREVNESGLALIVDEEDSNTEKYYAFHRSAPMGTIIRITNKSNARKVYVKVVGQLSNPSNDKAIIRISKASAEKLGATDSKIEVDLVYGVDKE